MSSYNFRLYHDPNRNHKQIVNMYQINKIRKDRNIIACFLVFLTTLTAIGQNTNTITIGMEHRVQNVIGTNIFMYKCGFPNEEFKGLPTDTTSFRLYEQASIVCALVRVDQKSDSYFCVFDINEDHDFSNDYHYYFTRKQILDERVFTPQRYANIWIAPRIRLNGVAGHGGTVTSPLAFDELVPMLSVHDFFIGNFDYQGKTYHVCSANNKEEFAVTDSIPANNDELARKLLQQNLLRKVQFPIIRDNLIFKFIDINFSRQQCRISVTPLTNATMPTTPYEGFRAPAISAKDIKGKTVKLGSNYTLLDFWGTWCKPCISIIPELVDIHQRYPKLNLVSVAVEGSMDDLPKLKKLTKELNMDWTHVCQLHGDTANVASNFDVFSFPTTIIIDPDGKIIYRGSGSNSTDKLKAKLREIFRE